MARPGKDLNSPSPAAVVDKSHLGDGLDQGLSSADLGWSPSSLAHVPSVNIFSSGDHKMAVSVPPGDAKSKAWKLRMGYESILPAPIGMKRALACKHSVAAPPSCRWTRELRILAHPSPVNAAHETPPKIAKAWCQWRKKWAIFSCSFFWTPGPGG